MESFCVGVTGAGSWVESGEQMEKGIVGGVVEVCRREGWVEEEGGHKVEKSEEMEYAEGEGGKSCVS